MPSFPTLALAATVVIAAFTAFAAWILSDPSGTGQTIALGLIVCACAGVAVAALAPDKADTEDPAP